jgi:hypothetical protein
MYHVEDHSRDTKKGQNVQHQGFPGGHPPEYWSGGYWLIDGRADGIPSFPVPMVVHGRDCSYSDRCVAIMEM